MVAFKKRNDTKGNKNGRIEKEKILKETVVDRRNDGEDAKEKMVENKSN